VPGRWPPARRRVRLGHGGTVPGSCRGRGSSERTSGRRPPPSRLRQTHEPSRPAVVGVSGGDPCEELEASCYPYPVAEDGSQAQAVPGE
jgi:hypothetical protein